MAEMGGKNAIIVFPDADMDEAVTGVLHSAFGHAGQKCSACSRVLVHREVYDRFAQRLIEAARSLPIGTADQPGTVINPVIDMSAKKRIIATADEARTEGRVLLDLLDCEGSSGACVGPLILEVRTEDAETAVVAQEEIFGPILPLIPFNTDEEAVSIVNSTAYALTLGIFSRSPSIIKKMVKACRAGNIYVNRKITGARVGIEPFDGTQLSGTGPKTGGEEYVLAFLTRREGFRSGPIVGRQVQNSPTSVFPAGVGPWDSIPVGDRHSILTAALDILTVNESKLVRALSLWKGVGRGKALFLADRVLVLQRRISKCDVWPFVFGHERAIAVGSWQYVVRFKLVTKTTLPDKLSL